MALSFSSVQTAHRKVHSDGFSFYHLASDRFAGLIDPILNLDHFQMSERPFPPRPLAGFSAVTAILETSRGGFVARDHLGMNATIEPGGLYGLVSGMGMIAEERPAPGTICEGVHVSINLPSKEKKSAPKSFFLRPSEVRVWSPNPSLRARVLLGRIAGVEAPVSLPEAVSFFEYSMKTKMGARPRVPPNGGGLLYVLAGSLRVSSGDEIHSLGPFQAVGFSSGEREEELLVEAMTECHFLFLSGRSCREPVVSHGAFVMNTATEIDDAIQRYQSGEMGRLDPS